ncbi:MBL fold metallo-hydrolase [Peribacillus alkalitolerans]|uniref:MBL fold metallo-hydrolase n=1 Tax=Peribacillus alkalitolerans TaxID=1550385 RepID=UPI0013D3EC2C|nr:MBL fold metallo-hydrolase [Peribacillus alkalitolerans]
MQTLERISDKFWFQTPVSETDRPILGVVVGDKQTLMIDAGNSEAHAKYFLEELSERNIPIPNLVAITHWHWDHIFGLSALKMPSISSIHTKIEMEKMIPYLWTDEALDDRVKDGIEIEFCSTAIKKEFGNNRDIQISLPTITFKNRLEIDLGGVTCILQHVGGDHSYDSVVVYVKEEKILFLADSIYPDIYNEKRNYTIKNTLSLLTLLETFDANTYILSHWKPISKEEFEVEAHLLRTVAKITETFQGDFIQMKEAFETYVERPLTEDEIETLEYFANGYEMQNK